MVGSRDSFMQGQRQYSPQVAHHALVVKEQVADFLAGVRAQAVELQTDAERDMGVARPKWLLPVGLTTLLSLFSLALPITVLPGPPKQGHARLPLQKRAC